jgi:hypothetical protein
MPQRDKKDYVCMIRDIGEVFIVSSASLLVLFISSGDEKNLGFGILDVQIQKPQLNRILYLSIISNAISFKV